MSPSLRDPLAFRLASGWSAKALGLFASESRLVGAARLALRAVSLGLVDHNTVRMAVVDAYIRDWLAQGVEQVVILGAGLDSRAWRLKELAGRRVFEVDQQATQAVKLRRSEPLPEPFGIVRFVSANFEQPDNLPSALTASGFEPSEPAIWVCEGVTAYLEPEVTARLLHCVGALSAAGSKLVVSYVAPPTTRRVQRQNRVFFELAQRLGERAPGIVASAQIADMARQAGFSPLEDLAWEEWKARTGSKSSMPNLLEERLLVAERRSASNGAADVSEVAP